MNSERFYVRMDADNVGEKLELFLLRGRIAEAEQLHEAIQAAMKELRRRVLEEGFDILFAGCDDALFSGPIHLYKRVFLENLRAFFLEATRCTLSCGVGFSMAEALQNLRISKLAGRDRIVEPSGS